MIRLLKFLSYKITFNLCVVWNEELYSKAFTAVKFIFNISYWVLSYFLNNVKLRKIEIYFSAENFVIFMLIFLWIIILKAAHYEYHLNALVGFL